MTIRISLLNIFIVLLLSTPSIQFTEETIKFAVSEDAPINTVIEKLTPLPGFSYRLSRGNSKIRFDDQTLEFTSSAPLDRESENAIDMLVITSPPSIIHVLVDILDVNDNSPKFPIDVQKIEIPETAPIGFRTQILGATDPDNGANGTIGEYSLVGTTVDTETPFRVVQFEDFVFLEVTGKLDREQREIYEMRMTAKDQGTPPLSSSSLLNIRILDINDNPPDFGTRTLRLHWNGLPYAHLFQLNATDPDSGENSRLTYRILPGGGPNANGFEIIRTAEQGDILVTQNSTSCIPRCELVIEARDSGTPSLATTLNVEVVMEYGNEHEPNINIRFYPSDYPFIVVQPEDVNGKTLAILSLTDPDGPLGENATIRIENGNEKSIFSLISRQSINILTLRNQESAEKENTN
uniref:Cadherin-23 n=1 Tax=Caenorhabditis tropicalis TaxID=1561998 RepID=A0A1I7ULN7_9PELO